MNKFLRISIVCFFTTAAYAQIPAGYYNNAYVGGAPKTCDILKTALFNIISSNTVSIPYNAPNGGFDTRQAMNILDIHRNDANTADIIWDMYTDNPTGAELYSFTPVTNQCGSYTGIGDCYNREHSFPEAWFGTDGLPMKTDMHHVFGTDGYTNGKHDNFPFGDVNPGAINWQSPAGARLGACSFPGYAGRVFEPIDEYKGDFARAMFYMVTRYESSIVSWQGNGNGGADAVLNGTTWPAYDDWAIKQWYKWHVQDPVSAKEIARNNGVYAIQNNRNPFIDHPEFVELVWRCTNLLPVTLVDFKANKTANAISLNWVVTRETNFSRYEIERSTDGINFNKIGTVTAQNAENYSAADNSLPNSKNVFYRLKMLDIDGRFSYSKTVTVRLFNNSGMLIYPNPATQELTIKMQQAFTQNGHISITDVAGKLVIDKLVLAGQNVVPVNIQQLAAGKYFITVQSKEGLTQDSFIKLK